MCEALQQMVYRHKISNDDRKSTVFSSQRNVVSDGAFLTDDGRLFHARAEATGEARSPSVECLVDDTTSMAVSRAQTTSSVDVRCAVGALSKVRRRCSMKTAVGQIAQPEYDSLRNSQPMEFTKQWGYACSDHLAEKNQTGGGIHNELQPI